MPLNRQTSSANTPLAALRQIAGDNSILIGQARDVIINQLEQHPRRFFAILGGMLLFAILGLSIVVARLAALIGLPIRFLQPLVWIVCGSIAITPIPTATVQLSTFSPSSITTATPTATFMPAPTISSVVPSVTNTPAVPIASCITRGDNLRVRDRPHPDQLSNILFTVKDGTNVTPLARDQSGEWIKVQLNGTEGWISAQFVECASAEALPTEIGLPRITPSPTRTPTPTGVPITSPVPPSTPGPIYVGSWSGKANGQPISFQVVRDSFGSESVVNLSVAYQFEASCPLGLVTFTSQGAAHIFWAPDNSFHFLNMAQQDASANVDGAFASGSEATGQLRVTSSVWLHDQCSFTKDRLISWRATKQ